MQLSQKRLEERENGMEIPLVDDGFNSSHISFNYSYRQSNLPFNPFLSDTMKDMPLPLKMGRNAV